MQRAEHGETEEQKSMCSTEASNSNPNQPTKWNDKDVNRYIIVIVIINIENDLSECK